MECVETVLSRLDSDGFLLVNDYGPTLPEQVRDHSTAQRFGPATAMGLNFPRPCERRGRHVPALAAGKTAACDHRALSSLEYGARDGGSSVVADEAQLSTISTMQLSGLAVLVVGLTAAAQEKAPQPIAHFHHLHLNVTDPASAINFYAAKLECERRKSPVGYVIDGCVHEALIR